ncbi:MAG: hypothetical protein AAF961_02680 [Planctomycetota bacterium]
MTCQGWQPTRVAARAGFTLMEVVLAIALTSVVLFLLTTAIELYMIRVDSSRSRVESAQAARIILDQIAADIKAARFLQTDAASAAGASGGFGADAGGSGDSSGSQGGADASADAGSSTQSMAAELPGVNGQQTDIRIDRTALSYWDRLLRSQDALLESDATTGPQTTRYYLEDGSRLSSLRAAQQGVETTPAAKVAGLYRQSIPSAALAGDGQSPLAATLLTELADVQLLAPEVVQIEFSYFDGEQFYDMWDMAQMNALPIGVEIRLKVLDLSYEESLQLDARGRSTGAGVSEKQVIEYRRFVSLPSLRRMQPNTQYLLFPQSQGGRGQSGDGSSGNEGSDRQSGGGDAR